MINVAIYSDQPILAGGLESVISLDVDLQVSEGVSNLKELGEHLADEKPDIAVLDLTAELTITVLEQLHRRAPDCRLILWVESISGQFAKQALAVGVCGILRKNLPVEAHRRCLHNVGTGQFWLEKRLIAGLLSTRSVTLTPRESQLATLLGRGLKNKEISHELGLTEGTVKVYLSHLFRKSGAKSRFDVALQVLSIHDGRLSGGSGPLVMEFSSEKKDAGFQFVPRVNSPAAHASLAFKSQGNLITEAVVAA